MDPFAALGAAAAIAQFIELSLSLVNGARQIHKSAVGATAANEQLGTVIRELEALSGSMVSKKPRHEQGNAEKSLSNVAAECQILSKKILDLLLTMKAKDPASIRQSAVAALRSAWNEKEKRELVELVEKCRSMMHMQLTVILGSATVQRIEDLIKTGKSNVDELSSLQKNVDALRSGVRLAEIGPDVEQQLRSLLNISETAIQAVSQRRILNSLSFGKMHQRFSDVANENPRTFKWILQQPSDEDSHTSKACARFRDWLLSGNGIFHIAGKLGSGKSTFMKFIYSQGRTIDLLKTWAGTKQLVVAKFFFWMPGTTMENSIDGLIRTILYDVLQKCPELISIVFPEQWKEVQYLPWQTSVELHLDSNEIAKAFRQLLACRNSKRPRRFCFFIDGLDEFKGDGKHDYGDLVNLLQKWTQATPEDPELCNDVKLCVSSRQNNVFMDRLADAQRLRLQDLNRADLENYVLERLESNPVFSTLRLTQATRDELVGQIVDGASGVFLWAVLIMVTLRQGLDDGDGLLELQRKIDSVPSDLQQAFHSIIATIHKADRLQSARTFTIISTVEKYCHGDRLSLFAYSFLNEFLEDPEFAFTLPTGPRSSYKEIAQRLERTRKQLYGRCKGLIEIRDAVHDSIIPDIRDFTLIHRITVAHRAIYEFLESPENQDWITPYLGGFSPVSAICQSTIAMVKCLWPLTPGDTTKTCYGRSATSFHSGIWIALCCIRRNRLKTETQFKILDCLDEVLSLSKVRDAAITKSMHLGSQDLVGTVLPYFLTEDRSYHLDIHQAAAYMGLLEYTARKFEVAPRVEDEPWRIVSLLQMQVDPIRRSEKWTVSLLPLVESIFKRRISLNLNTTQHSGTTLLDGPIETRPGVWPLFLQNHFHNIFENLSVYLPILEILFKYGADPRVLISLIDPDRATDNFYHSYRVSLSFSFYHKVSLSFSFYHKRQFDTEIMSFTTVTYFLSAKGRAASLRDIVVELLEQEESESARKILTMIDQSIKLLEKRPTALEVPSPALPVLPTETESLPSPGKDKSPLASPDGEETAKEMHLVDGAKRAKGDINSQLMKWNGAEETRRFLSRVLEDPLASFLVGIVIASLCFYLMSSWREGGMSGL